MNVALLIGILVVETIFLFVLLYDDRRDRTETAVSEFRSTYRREIDAFLRNVERDLDEIDHRLSTVEIVFLSYDEDDEDDYDDEDPDPDDDDDGPCRCDSRPFEPAEAAGDFID